jgi:hypothetical protein
MIVFIQSFLDMHNIRLFKNECSEWMINYAAYFFLSLALTMNLIEWTKVGLATQSLILKSLSFYVKRKSFLMKALIIIIPVKFILGFLTSLFF